MEDRISNLPADIIDDILSHLPLRDAVRTSLLSRQWRYKWTILPHLVFDEESVLGASHHHLVFDDEYVSEDSHRCLSLDTLVNIVDHVLLLHSGPIYKFKLSFFLVQSFQGLVSRHTPATKIDLWILFLLRIGTLKEIVLEIHDYDYLYELPSFFYPFHNLVHLDLYACTIKTFPSTFTGFRSLKTLHLVRIRMSQDVFEVLVSNCPLLEDLTLIAFQGFTHLNINAPNLLYLVINGFFEKINLQNTFQLAKMFIAGKDIAHYSSGNMMIKFFDLLPRLQELEVQNYFINYLASGVEVPKRLRNPCIALRRLSIHVNFEDKQECNAALCILRSSPNIGNLDIRARPQPDEEHEIGGALMLPNTLQELEDEGIYQDCIQFTHLRLIKIHISGCARELNFIKFLLSNSPVLERITIKPPNYMIGFKLLKQIINFRRASVHAKIEFLD